MFFGMFPAEFAVLAPVPPSLATLGAMRETMPA